MAKKKSSEGCAIKPDEEWQVENDLNTLQRAKEIEADPKRLAKVRVMARKRLEQHAMILGETSENE